MKKIILIILISFSFGGIIHVPGDDDITIQVGINAAMENDTVLVGKFVLSYALYVTKVTKKGIKFNHRKWHLE